MKQESQRGSLTVEATVSLTVFIFFIITILSLINICRAQAKIAVAVDSVAKEISQYSYFYGISGLHKKHEELAGMAGDTSQSIDNIIGNTNELYDSIQSIAETGMSTDIGDVGSVLESWENISQKAAEGEATLKELEQQVDELCSDPKKLILGIGAIFANEAINDVVSRVIAPPIAKALSKKHFKDSFHTDADSYLESLGVVDGLDGIDFSNSRLFPDGQNKIEIVAVYKVRIIRLFPIESEFVFYQTASTKGWLLGDKKE